jgi:Integrase core domain
MPPSHIWNHPARQLGQDRNNGSEFVAKVLLKWLSRLGTQPPYIEPGSRWENGYCESFNSKLRDESCHPRTDIPQSPRDVQVVRFLVGDLLLTISVILSGDAFDLGRGG